MKKLIALSAIFFAVVLTSNVFAQNTATASANATARVMTPITIAAETNGLQFGTFSSSNAAGTVSIAATEAGTRSATGGVTLSSVLGTSGSAQYTVTGETGALFSVTLPSSIVIKSGANEMEVYDFSSNATTTLTGGTQTFYVGATIQVDAAQPTGDYTGTYNVTVTYN